MNLPDYFAAFARYNRWLNERLYETCARIPDAARKEYRGAFFKSIHGTLNHLLLIDRVWMGRLVGPPFPMSSLDQEVHSNFDDLRADRVKTDAMIEEWVAGFTEQKLDEPVTFDFVVDGQKKAFTYPLWHVAGQLFNHQTHHRGQLTTLMVQAGYDPGVTDFLKMPGTPLHVPGT